MATELLTAEALNPALPPIDLATLVRDLWQDSMKSKRKRFTRQKEELDFALKHQHYVYENPQMKDQRQVKPHSVHLFHLLRHKWSQIVQVPTFLECRPQDPGSDDPQLAEDAKLALESVLHNPLNGYNRLRRRWVMGGLAARSWVMAIDYDTAVGDATFRLVEPWRFHRAPGWSNFHETSCPWVIEESTMRIQDAKRMQGWQNVELLHPDTPGALDTSERAVTLRQMGGSLEEQPSDQQTVTILKAMFRRDEAIQETRTEYSECRDCGYRGMSEETACPACGGQMTPQLDIQQEPAYPYGRMLIVAPYSRVVLYDGPWICPLRSFPYMEFRCYEHPIDDSGLSDTAIQWDNLVLLNLTKRFAWEQLRRSPGLYSFPAEGLLNAQRQPFTYSDLHGQIAYWTNPQSARGINFFPGAPLNPATMAFHSLIADDFRSGSGISDLGLTPEQSRDVPVGTVKQFVSQGDIPVRDHVAQLQEEESIGFGVLLDLLVHTWGPERAVRYLGPNGEWKVKNLQQSSLTSMEVVVTASPQLAQIKADELQGFIQWAALFAENPALGVIVARLANIPMSLVRELQASQMVLPGLGVPGMGMGLPPAIAQRLAMNGGLAGPPASGGAQ